MLFPSPHLRALHGDLTTIALQNNIFTGFKTGPGSDRFFFIWARVGHPGQSVLPPDRLRTLSRHFEKSHLPVVLPKFLPHDWKGAFTCLC
jgi:hypothetical protein